MIKKLVKGRITARYLIDHVVDIESKKEYVFLCEYWTITESLDTSMDLPTRVVEMQE